jgi:hypothetical protein
LKEYERRVIEKGKNFKCWSTIYYQLSFVGGVTGMKYNEVSNLSDILEEGFFSDRVVDLLKERRPVDSSGQKTLCEILAFIEKARSGEEQVNTGKLSSDAVDSIGAYSRAINMIAYLLTASDQEKKALENLLDTIDKEVKTAIENNTIEPKKLGTTFAFFKFVKNQTLREASSYYSRKVEVIQWPSLLF